MNTLPDEILLQILNYLDLHSVTTFQRVSKHFLHLARDSGFWKLRCYDESKFESNRRRQLLLSTQDPSLAALSTAMTASSLGLFPPDGTETDVPRVENGAARASKSSARTRALASWDPSYPGEEINFHQDYIQRYAPSYVDWLETADNNTSEREVIGVAAIHQPDKTVQNLVTAQEDGSVRIWDISSSGSQIIGETKAGTLAMATSNKDKETGGIDNISIDSQQRKAYIAISNHLHELDLNTLQVTRKQAFPFHITALSEARYPIPLTIGTNQTLHLFDPRSSYTPSTEESTTRLELIGGTPPKDSFLIQTRLRSPNSAITLEQPGPTSILHLPASSSSSQNDDTIIVAGRFTSLLTYSRRFWPKTTSTLFSGARLSSLTYLSYPYIPRSLTQTLTADPSLSLSILDAAKAAPGVTLIAAGEYKGKGSLELYGLPRGHANGYRNRQTASRTRLIAVATHGTSIVFSDGDGNMKWVERNGSTLVREQCISAPTDHSRRSSVSSHSPGVGVEAQTSDEEIVQKILPVRLTSSSSAWPDDLVVQTGDGKVGVLGFGRRPLQWHDNTNESTDDENETMEEKAVREEVSRKEGEERKFGRIMREALQRQADEVRWLGGLGLGRRM